MRCSSTAIWLAIVSLTAVVSIGPRAGFAGSPSNRAWISPISLSANLPGLKISPQLIERLVLRTDLNRSEVEQLGLRVGELSEQDLRNLLDSEPYLVPQRYIRYFDMRFEDASKQPGSKVWKSVSGLESFIRDAISLGGFDRQEETRLRQSLMKAAKKGDKPEQLEARTKVYQLLLEARMGAVRKARGYRQLVDTLEIELDGRREFDWNIALVVDIRTNAKRPTISPLSLVTMRCAGEPDAEFVFHERRRECDEFGVCRIEAVAAVDDGPQYKALFRALRYDGRDYLDKCKIITKMLIDGAEVSSELPGKFTSNIAGQSR